MTDPLLTQAGPGDHRRALSALAHYLHRDMTGLTAVLQEANDVGRRIEMVVALMHGIEQFLPEFRTDLGQQLLRQQIMFAAKAEGEEEEDDY